MVKSMVSIEKIFAFLLGVFICEGVTMPFSVGNTVFTVSEIISPIIFICLLSKKDNKFLSFLKNVPIGFKLFFLVVIFSILPSIVIFGIGNIYRYFVGLIYFCVILTIAADVYLLKDYRRNLYKGMLLGFVLNILFSAICFFSFQAGIVISLEEIFPRESFFTPFSSFRAQGFFLEPSHFVRFVSSVVLILMANVDVKNIILKFIFIVISIFVLLQSFSGSVVILMVGVLLYSIIRKKERKINILPGAALFVFSIVVLIVLLFLNNEMSANVHFSLSKIFSGADITDEGNAERFNSMKIVLSNLSIATVGCGWNMANTFFEVENLGIVSAFSDILEMTIEIGFLGILIYIISLIKTAFNLIKFRTKKSVALGLTVLIILALQIGTDYAFNTCVMVVFGLVVCEISDNKMQLG